MTAATVAVALAALTAAVALIRLYASSRRAIVFDAWADFTGGEGDRGKSLADLLLFQIREIQSAHSRSGGSLDLKNPYDDIPAFQQDLDADLRAAVELQRQSRFVGPIVSLILALMPVRPARLRGSIHRFGDDFVVTVVFERGPARVGSAALQWKTEAKPRAEDLPALIEDLAHQIYLALARSAAFSDAGAFREYTAGLSSHLRYGELGRPEDHRAAEARYKEALRLEPRNPAAAYNLGVLHYYMYDQHRNEEAQECFETGLHAARGALRAQIHSGLANVFSTRYHRFKSGDPEDLTRARDHAEEALRLDDGLDVVLKAAAFAYQQSSEAAASGEEAERYRGKAIAYYRRAIAVNPNYYTAHNNLGNLYLELAKKSERKGRRELLLSAIDLFKATTAIRPAYQHAYDNLGNAYYELGRLGEPRRFDDAAGYYREALSLDSGYAEARNDLAMLYLTPEWPGRDEDEARRLHEEAIGGLPPDNPRRMAMVKAFEARAGGAAPAGAPASPSGRRAGGLPPVAREARRQRRRRALTALPQRRSGRSSR